MVIFGEGTVVIHHSTKKRSEKRKIYLIIKLFALKNYLIAL